MGFELMGTGAGAAQGLQELLARRLAEQHMQQQGLGQLAGILGQREDRQARLAETKSRDESLAAAREDANRNRELATGLQLKQSMRPSEQLGETSFNRLVKTGAFLPEEFDKSQGTPASLPSTSMSGFMPLNQNQVGAVSETQESSRPIEPSYRFKGTAQQQDRERGLDVRESDLKRRADAMDVLNNIRQQNADKAPKEPVPHFNVQQTYDASGKPSGLVRINTLTGEVVPTAGANLKPPPGAAQQSQMEDKKKTGIQTVNRLDADIDQAAQMGLIGPAAGRYYQMFAKAGSTGDPKLDDMIGRLKADILLAKMHVDAGIGGMRAAASPLLLKNWEDLAMSSSPALLKGMTRAMRDDMGSASSTGGGGKKFEIIKVE